MHLKHDSRPGKVTLPHPRKDFSKKLLASIEKQSGVRLR